MTDLSFYKNKKVLITGNTGFKGSWMSYVLLEAGAEVVGYALKPIEEINLFEILQLDGKIKTYYQDIRDIEELKQCFEEEQPEIVFHMAAQPLVRDSYKNPAYTYECNVMGTVNVLECIRQNSSVKSFLNVTTDKVYRNNEWEWGYRENDVLDGFDPYSNSKSCSELVTETYKRSFPHEILIPISTARAGNVIGGGDFAIDRIVPDCFRAATQKKQIQVRNPNSIRPYQHVLEPILAYLLIAEKQYEDALVAGNYNVGPENADCISTGKLADYFCSIWGDDLSWGVSQENGPQEANFLKLDCSRIKKLLGWDTTWSVYEALDKTVEWQKGYLQGEDMRKLTSRQIVDFLHVKRG